MTDTTEKQAVKITAFEAESFKRIRLVHLKPSQDGLTVIGGNNGEGKTCVLDAIIYGLGGEKYRPSNIVNEQDGSDPYIRIELSNGLTVERKGKKSSLKVTYANGQRGSQSILNEFVETLALDLPKFMEKSSIEKAKVLLKIIGAEEQLERIEAIENETYQNRAYARKDLDHAEADLDCHPRLKDVPGEEVNVGYLLKQISEADEKRREDEDLMHDIRTSVNEIKKLEDHMSELEKDFERSRKILCQEKDSLEQMEITQEKLEFDDVNELTNELKTFQDINDKVRQNKVHTEKQSAVIQKTKNWQSLDRDLYDIRSDKDKILKSAKMPLEGLTVCNGELMFRDQAWDGMSGSEQLIVATSIVKALKPSCGFVLLDKLEQMDVATLEAFGAWAASQGFQVIATRVSTGKECSIIIEDGYEKESE